MLLSRRGMSHHASQAVDFSPGLHSHEVLNQLLCSQLTYTEKASCNAWGVIDNRTTVGGRLAAIAGVSALPCETWLLRIVGFDHFEEFANRILSCDLRLSLANDPTRPVSKNDYTCCPTRSWTRRFGLRRGVGNGLGVNDDIPGPSSYES